MSTRESNKKVSVAHYFAWSYRRIITLARSWMKNLCAIAWYKKKNDNTINYLAPTHFHDNNDSRKIIFTGKVQYNEQKNGCRHNGK